MWDPRRLTNLWPSRPVTGIALLYMVAAYSSVPYSRIHIPGYITVTRRSKILKLYVANLFFQNEQPIKDICDSSIVVKARI
jgi:hypothetical protein